MVSAPVRAASAATTLESTPPDIATTIRRAFRVLRAEKVLSISPRI